MSHSNSQRSKAKNPSITNMPCACPWLVGHFYLCLLTNSNPCAKIWRLSQIIIHQPSDLIIRRAIRSCFYSKLLLLLFCLVWYSKLVWIQLFCSPTWWLFVFILSDIFCLFMFLGVFFCSPPPLVLPNSLLLTIYLSCKLVS